MANATVTRTSKTFKAALNYAARIDPAAAANRQAWQEGLRALPDSQLARGDAYLPDATIRDFVAACYAYSDQLGLLVEVLATTGARPIQVFRLLVGDLQSDRLLLPRSKKGRGRKRIDRRPIPIPPALAGKLKAAAADRPVDAPLLRRPDGKAWQTGNHSRPWKCALAAAGLPQVVPYQLRHSSVIRNLQRGVPAALVADFHDTSLAMLRATYAAYISDYSEPALRAAQTDFSTLDAERSGPGARSDAPRP
jgi:integrase